jgi:cold shock CspA family protein
MQGQITKFRSDIGIGVITADDGAKYRFAINEIVNRVDDLTGHSVDFLVHQRRPKEILVLAGSPWTVFAGSGRPQ